MTPAKPLRLAVKAVILDDDHRCLLLRRSAANRSLVGSWEWPGGKLEAGEDFVDGLRREVREETGLEIELTTLGGAAQFEITVARVILLCLEARPLTSAVRLSEEHDDFAWVPLKEVAQRNIIEPMKPVLKSLLERTELP